MILCWLDTIWIAIPLLLNVENVARGRSGTIIKSANDAKWYDVCNKTQYHYVFNAMYNKALMFLVRQHFSARSIFSLRSRSQVLINIPPQFDEGQEKVILSSCCLSSHVVTCYDAKSGGLRIEIDRRLLPSIWCKWAFTFVRPDLNPENVCQEQNLKNC